MFKKRKMFISTVGCYRVQVVGKKCQVFYKKEDSVYEVPQQLYIEDRQSLENLFTAIGSVIDQYKQDRDE